jgi:hypothetical protein
MSAADSAALHRAAIRAGYLLPGDCAVSSMRAFVVRKPLKATALQHRLAWLRIRTMRALIRRAFGAMSPNAPCQLVSLGAGFDLARSRAARVTPVAFARL